MTSHAVKNSVMCSALVVASMGLALSAPVQSEAKVTGSWMADGGGTYSMRRINDDIRWIGDGPATGGATSSEERWVPIVTQSHAIGRM